LRPELNKNGQKMLSFKFLLLLLTTFGVGIAAPTDCNITDPDLWVYTAVCDTDIRKFKFDAAIPLLLSGLTLSVLFSLLFFPSS